MKLALLEPSLLHISDQDWINDEERDSFLEHLGTILKTINDNDFFSIAWHETIDELLWSNPQQPWRLDSKWSNSLIPIIYKRIQHNTTLIPFDFQKYCLVNPSFKTSRLDFYKIFLNILSYVYLHKKDFFICLGLKNIPVISRDYIIEGMTNIKEPIYISCLESFFLLNSTEIEDKYWPTDLNCSDLLKEGIAILLKRDYPLISPPLDYMFSESFTKRLCSVTNDKKRILSAITTRLSLTQSEACLHGSLQDEKLERKGTKRGKSNRKKVTENDIFRFRVSQVKRIHYRLKDEKIDFLMFYDEGEHDDPL